jgi:uncharacterized DUF497 family protein
MNVNILWDLDDEPDGNVQHIEQHGLTKDDVADVVAQPDSFGVSRSSGRRMVYGYTADGRYIAVVYDMVDDDTIYPVTAFETTEP